MAGARLTSAKGFKTEERSAPLFRLCSLLVAEPWLGLMTGVAGGHAIIHVLSAGGAERCVVKTDQAKRFFDVLLKFVKRF